MKKIFVLFILFSNKIYSQSLDTFILETIPNYDEFGNLFTVSKKYDHVPTKQDSLDFDLESEKQIKKMMAEVRKDYLPVIVKPKSKNKTSVKRKNK